MENGLACGCSVSVHGRFYGACAVVDIIVELIELKLDHIGLVVFIVEFFIVEFFIVQLQLNIVRFRALQRGDKQICRSVCDWCKLDEEAFVYCDGQRFHHLE